MERYLVFNPGCAACSRLAETVQGAAGAKLQTISIQDEQAKTLLDQAYPQGWEFAPYLITVDGGRVHAWTGVGAAVRLGLLMGPRQALRVWSLARRSGVPLPPGSKPPRAFAASRREFLKVGAALAAALGWVGARGVTSAFACDPSDCGPYPGCGICSSIPAGCNACGSCAACSMQCLYYTYSCDGGYCGYSVTCFNCC